MSEKMTLLPCPFCGKATALYLLWENEIQGDAWDSSNDDSCHIVCDASTANNKGGCGASASFKLTSSQAITAWNTRAHLATPAQSVDIEAVEYVIDVLRLDAKTFSFTGLDNAHFVRLADKLTAALTEKGNG